jgi:wyosine [tRNA(Phe)-imidazoG37] synthetase (radical SAM superfamily)
MSDTSQVRRVTPGIVYGPVRSRRFGVSLGVNLSGDRKRCSFNCLYCFRGFNEDGPAPEHGAVDCPSCDQVIAELRAWSREHSFGAINAITLAGNGEPTHHPDFPGIVRRLIELRDAECPHAKIVVLTNGMGLVPRISSKHEAVLAALERCDCPCVKLDAGTPETWKRLANPIGEVELSEWLSAVERLQHPVIQSMLVQGEVDNTTPLEVAALRRCYQRLQPRKVYVLTFNKPPAEVQLRPVPADRLEELNRVLTDTDFLREEP